MSRLCIAVTVNNLVYNCFLTESQTSADLDMQLVIILCFMSKDPLGVIYSLSNNTVCDKRLVFKLFLNDHSLFFSSPAEVEGESRDMCHVTTFGCCPNGVSSADGPDYRGCGEDEKIET